MGVARVIVIVLLIAFSAVVGLFSLHNNLILTGGGFLATILFAVVAAVFVFKSWRSRLVGAVVLPILATAAMTTSNSIVDSRVLNGACTSVRNGGTEGFSVLFYHFTPDDRVEVDDDGTRTYVFTAPNAWYFVEVCQNGKDVRALLID